MSSKIEVKKGECYLNFDIFKTSKHWKINLQLVKPLLPTHSHDRKLVNAPEVRDLLDSHQFVNYTIEFWQDYTIEDGEEEGEIQALIFNLEKDNLLGPEGPLGYIHMLSRRQVRLGSGTQQIHIAAYSGCVRLCSLLLDEKILPRIGNYLK